MSGPHFPRRLIFILLISVICLARNSGKEASQSKPLQPMTVKEAARIVKTQWLSADDRDWILRNPEEAVASQLHFSLGMQMRNEFGLWTENSSLLKACGGGHPDDCSSKIISEIWRSIRADSSPEMVKRRDHHFKLLSDIPICYKGFYNMRTSEWLSSLRSQIESYLKTLNHDPKETVEILIRVQGSPDPNCYTRAEFSEDGNDPIPLSLFLGWFSFRNAFSVQHDPPYIEFIFSKKCAWPEKPEWFAPD